MNIFYGLYFFCYCKICNNDILILFTAGSNSIKIVDLIVPRVIQNGSRSSVVLDCEYKYEPFEKQGLVVKWFFNHNPEAVYQWIPGKPAKSLGVLRVSNHFLKHYLKIFPLTGIGRSMKMNHLKDYNGSN